MRLLFVDGQAGASGDMILGALVDLGVPLAELERALSRLPIRGFTLRGKRLVRHGLAGRRIDVRVRTTDAPRGFAAIARIVRAGRLSTSVRDRALAVFRRLCEAEAEAHGVSFARAHLHEAGATDAIVDVVGACWGIERLGVERIVVSPLVTGFGDIVCEHGTYPVPAPATLLLLRGLPVRGGDIEAERLTPTGAAILATLADEWGSMPPMRPVRVGHGAGARTFDRHPNYLRMVLGESAGERSGIGDAAGGEVLVLETTLDDVTPQLVAHACERLLEAGALDVWTSAVTMKKGRLGQCVTVLGRPERLEPLARCLFEQTTTLGVRMRIEQRLELRREVRAVGTPWGRVRVKRGTLDGRELRVAPEFEDCAALARERQLPLGRVQRAALEGCGRTPVRRRSRTGRRRIEEEGS
jgi:uncharacterized protein (TIGR00299 family) protein